MSVLVVVEASEAVRLEVNGYPLLDVYIIPPLAAF